MTPFESLRWKAHIAEHLKFSHNRALQAEIDFWRQANENLSYTSNGVRTMRQERQEGKNVGRLEGFPFDARAAKRAAKRVARNLQADYLLAVLRLYDF